MTKRRTREEKLAYELARVQEADTRTSLAEYEIEQLAGLLRSSVLEWQPLTFDRLRAQAEATRKRLDRAAVLYGADTEKTRTEQSEQSNAALAKRESAYRDRDVGAVEWFVTQVLAASVYPHGFPETYGVVFQGDTGDLLVEIGLPPADVIPAARAYRYVKTRDEIEPVPSPANEREELYTAVVAQTALRTVHEVFSSDVEGVIQSIVLNGYVTTPAHATGRDVRHCLITLQAGRAEFGQLALAQLGPLACLEALRSLISPNPCEPEPVRPLSSRRRKRALPASHERL